MERNIILIADDQEINREILKVIFEEQYEILEAADGVQAIDLIAARHDEIVLVFLDLLMPEKSGLDVLAYMTDQGYMDVIPVIMITGEATAELSAFTKNSLLFSNFCLLSINCFVRFSNLRSILILCANNSIKFIVRRITTFGANGL